MNLHIYFSTDVLAKDVGFLQMIRCTGTNDGFELRDSSKMLKVWPSNYHISILVGSDTNHASMIIYFPHDISVCIYILYTNKLTCLSWNTNQLSAMNMLSKVPSYNFGDFVSLYRGCLQPGSHKRWLSPPNHRKLWSWETPISWGYIVTYPSRWRPLPQQGLPKGQDSKEVLEPGTMTPPARKLGDGKTWETPMIGG